MKKTLIILLALPILAAACNKPAPTQNSDQNQSQTSDQQTYSNATYGFEFTYPKSMQFTTPTYPNLQDKVVQVQIPQSAYPNTNFGDAAFSVSASFAKNLADCLAQTPPEGGDGFKTPVTINGVQFYMTSTTGAGAGNIYEGRIYRTIKSTGGACIELSEMLHTSNIGNYPPDTVTAVNKTTVERQLDAILKSFKFSSR